MVFETWLVILIEIHVLLLVMVKIIRKILIIGPCKLTRWMKSWVLSIKIPWLFKGQWHDTWFFAKACATFAWVTSFLALLATNRPSLPYCEQHTNRPSPPCNMATNYLGIWNVHIVDLVDMDIVVLLLLSLRGC